MMDLIGQMMIPERRNRMDKVTVLESVDLGDDGVWHLGKQGDKYVIMDEDGSIRCRGNQRAIRVEWYRKQRNLV